CSEWGRVAILSAPARYEAEDEKESEHICERVVPQFQHVTASVVLGAVKISTSNSSEKWLKVEKLDIMVHLAKENNVDAICLRI
ncbi:hypothetical protein BGW80DRAFT_1316395, partial [Lactifluus volemus]